MNKILIIGTEPPCPRCGLLKNVIEKKVKELNLIAEIEHLAYTDKKSNEIANRIGLNAGTAKDVAKKINKEIDKLKLSELLQNKTSIANCEYKDYNEFNWSYELDEFLRPYEISAKNAGILMTPILIINGELKHQGSVPEIQKIINWLLEMNK